MEGKVTGIKPFGAFVALPESKTGLVHISEVSYEFVQDLATVLEAGQTVKVKVISIAPDGKIALSIKQTQPAPERAPRAPRSPRPQGQQGSNGGARPAGGRPPRREAAPRVWQPKPSQPQGDLSFEDMMARYKTQSEARDGEPSRWIFPPPRLISAAYANCNAHKMQALLGRAFFGLCNGTI